MKEKIETSDNIKIMKYLFDKDYENKVCVECKTPMPSFVSINNSIIICGKCAERHKKLGFNISYVRELRDDWDPYLLSFLERGGNSRYIRLSKKYELDNIPIEEKFNMKILEYYRILVSLYLIIFLFLQIKSEVLAEEPPLEIDLEVAKQPIESQKILFPEFENYQIFEGKEKIDKKEGNLIQAFRYVGKGLGSLTSYFGSKYQEYDINSKIKTGISTTGNFLLDLSKPIMNFAKDKAAQGMEYLYKQMTGKEINGEKKIIETTEVPNEMNIIKNEESEGASSSIFFQNDDNNNNNIENNLVIKEDYPTLSQVNKPKEEEEKDNSNNNSAAPITLK